jgi:hypothetical protein
MSILFFESDIIIIIHIFLINFQDIINNDPDNECKKQAFECLNILGKNLKNVTKYLKTF